MADCLCASDDAPPNGTGPPAIRSDPDPERTASADQPSGNRAVRERDTDSGDPATAAPEHAKLRRY